MSDYQRPQTRLPTHLDKEDPFLQIAEIALSLRQVMTILFAALLWGMLCMVTKMVFGIFVELPTPLLWLAFSWVLFGGFFLALKSKDINGNGVKIIYEEYLTKRLLFQMSPKKYVVKDTVTGNIEDADWKALDDEFAGWSAR